MTRGGVVEYLAVFLVSLLPVAEVRGSIPMVFVLFKDGESIAYGLAVAVVGNLLVAPIVLTALRWLDTLIINSRTIPTVMKRVYTRVISYGRSRSSRVNRYSLLALALFVALPLPGTGAWTGSLVAHVLGISRRRALIAIELGVLIASLIVSLASALGVELIRRIFLL